MVILVFLAITLNVVLFFALDNMVSLQITVTLFVPIVVAFVVYVYNPEVSVFAVVY